MASFGLFRVFSAPWAKSPKSVHLKKKEELAVAFAGSERMPGFSASGSRCGVAVRKARGQGRTSGAVTRKLFFFAVSRGDQGDLTVQC